MGVDLGVRKGLIWKYECYGVFFDRRHTILLKTDFVNGGGAVDFLNVGEDGLVEEKPVTPTRTDFLIVHRLL